MQCKHFLTGLVLLLSIPSFAAAQSADPDAPATTIYSHSDIVVVDVTVTDGQQNPVHQLTAGDFKLLEDGHLQTVKNFEEHSTPTTPPPIAPIPKLDEGTYTNYTPAPATGPLTILLLDTLNTYPRDQITVRNQLLKYLKEAKPGTEIEIFRLGTRLQLIKGFTTDIDELRTIMEKEKPNTSPLLDEGVSGMAFGNGQMKTEGSAITERIRIRYTLDDFNLLGRYLSSLQGRKNLIWFSESFPLHIIGDGVPESMLSDELRDTEALLTRGQVAVYPVDALGFRSDWTYDASIDNGPVSLGSTSAINSSHNGFTHDTVEAHNTMGEIAEATGGKAFIDTNDLSGAVEKVVAAGANYYTITYVPTNSAQNGYYRKIKVEVARKGVSLAYRRGYYSYDLNAQKHTNPAKEKTDDTGPEGAPYDALNAGMMRGAPAPTEIMLLVNARPSTADAESVAAPGNKVEAKVKGPFRRYTVSYNVAADNLSCPATPDGIHHCSLEILALVYDSYRGLVNTQINGVKLSIPPARYDSVLNHGLQFKQEISVPTEDGTYFLRTGVRDVTSGRVGAIEFPLSEVAKLTPVSATHP
jgi:VWFA-related protein